MKRETKQDPSAAKTTGSFGIWFLFALILTGAAFIFMLNSSEPKLDSGADDLAMMEKPTKPEKPLSPTQAEYVYRPVERDGGRAIAVPKSVRPAQLAVRSVSQDMDAEDEEMQRIIDLIEQGQIDEAEKLLSDRLLNNPSDELALIEMAMLQLIERKEPIRARDFLERAIVLNPDNEGAINELLVVYQETNNLEGGLDFLRSLAQTEQSSSAVEYGIANALMQSGRANEALEHYDRAMEIAGYDDLFLREQAASAYVEAGRFDEGVEMLRSVIAQETDVFRLKNLKIKLAAAYLNQQDRDEALRILYEAQSLHPDDELIAQIIKDLTSGRL